MLLSHDFREQLTSIQRQFNNWTQYEQLYSIIELTNSLKELSHKYFLHQFISSVVEKATTDMFTVTVHQANTTPILRVLLDQPLDKILVSLQLYLPLLNLNNDNDELLNAYHQIFNHVNKSLSSSLSKKEFIYSVPWSPSSSPSKNNHNNQKLINDNLVSICRQLLFFIRIHPMLQKLNDSIKDFETILTTYSKTNNDVNDSKSFNEENSNTDSNNKISVTSTKEERLHQPLQRYSAIRPVRSQELPLSQQINFSDITVSPRLEEIINWRNISTTSRNNFTDSGVDLTEIPNTSQNGINLSTYNNVNEEYNSSSISTHSTIGRSHSANLTNVNYNHPFVTKTISSPTPESLNINEQQIPRKTPSPRFVDETSPTAAINILGEKKIEVSTTNRPHVTLKPALSAPHTTLSNSFYSDTSNESRFHRHTIISDGDEEEEDESSLNPQSVLNTFRYSTPNDDKQRLGHNSHMGDDYLHPSSSSTNFAQFFSDKTNNNNSTMNNADIGLQKFCSLRYYTRPDDRVSQYLGVDGSNLPRNTFIQPNTGMRDVPKWLKNLRLHKYTIFFSQLTYDEMMNLTLKQLKDQLITDGACSKILLHVKKLKERKIHLKQMLNDIDNGVCDIKIILQQLLDMLLTPIRGGVNLKVNKLKDVNNNNKENENHETQEKDHNNDIGKNNSINEFEDDEEDLPTIIMQVLEKIYNIIYPSSSLSSSISNRLTPNINNMITSKIPNTNTLAEICNTMVGLCDQCYKHEAFPQQKRFLLLQWRGTLCQILQSMGKLSLQIMQPSSVYQRRLKQQTSIPTNKHTLLRSTHSTSSAGFTGNNLPPTVPLTSCYSNMYHNDYIGNDNLNSNGIGGPVPLARSWNSEPLGPLTVQQSIDQNNLTIRRPSPIALVASQQSQQSPFFSTNHYNRNTNGFDESILSQRVLDDSQLLSSNTAFKPPKPLEKCLTLPSTPHQQQRYIRNENNNHNLFSPEQYANNKKVRSHFPYSPSQNYSQQNLHQPLVRKTSIGPFHSNNNDNNEFGRNKLCKTLSDPNRLRFNNTSVFMQQQQQQYQQQQFDLQMMHLTSTPGNLNSYTNNDFMAKKQMSSFEHEQNNESLTSMNQQSDDNSFFSDPNKDDRDNIYQQQSLMLRGLPQTVISASNSRTDGNNTNNENMFDELYRHIESAICDDVSEQSLIENNDQPLIEISPTSNVDKSENLMD
ncbi:unnamed protein product [Didymodactylos carnosus]|uniref:SAM domain-containing protein n=1 Tax=Didymodactylos carnosus TaxID=1234261 RepID=A0A813S1H4_9BILA|nr:unnamed protein product [Didymodactylos carnosus]CAF3572942.1 unnamed protein product [Didymodactylos carnosus]